MTGAPGPREQLLRPRADARLAVGRILAVVRSQLAMDMAAITACTEDGLSFELIDGDAGSFGLRRGETLPLVDTHCGAMLAGMLPNRVSDTGADRLARALPLNDAANVGAYLGVPLYLWDGRLYGTLCCFSHARHATLDDRDVGFARAMASVIAERLERQEIESGMLEIERRRISAVLRWGQLGVVLQPIFDLQRRECVGFEVLARFEAAPDRSPAAWSEAAASVGLGEELELLAVRAALGLLAQLPKHATVSINISPAVAASEALFELVAPIGDRVVLELTEHARVDDYEALEVAVKRLRACGARIAIDDVGAGFASLRHIRGLCPDILKLDLSLTRDIDGDPARRALAASLASFAREIDATIAAEGIESHEELTLLRELGIDYGQGFYLGPPQPLLEALSATLSVN
ncbi:MAG TPA: EAL domain-containing protein [Gaiellaceae bacterium]|nr:EAL domain-containing protein [Gaiellaceae bacterium]